MAAGRGYRWLVPLLLVVGCSRALTPGPSPPPPGTASTPAPSPPAAPPAPSTPSTSTPPPASAPPPTTTAKPRVETGQASWYGQQHHGKRTASGEIYDMHDLTAAHRTLPLGTRVLVTNTSTGDAVEVRINDRGPFAEGRIIDLSYAAGRMLGAVGRGVIPVRVQVLALPDGTPASGQPRLTIQVAAFASRDRAEAVRRKLAGDGFDAAIGESQVDGETYYRVRVGSYADHRAAEESARRLADRGYRAVIVDR